MRGMLVCPVIGAGSGGPGGSPIRAQVHDLHARDGQLGDRLEAIGPGARTKCLVAFDVAQPAKLGDYGGNILLTEDELDISAGQLQRAAAVDALAREFRVDGTGRARDVIRRLGRVLDPNYNEAAHLGRSTAPRPGSFADDLFTDADGTLLHNHTPTGSGTSWVRHASLNNSMQVISNRVRQTTSSANTVNYVSADPAGTEYDLSALIRVVTEFGGEMFLAARIATGAVTLYTLGVTHVDTARIDKWLAGTATTLSTATQNVADANNYTFAATIRDAAKKFFFQGGEILSTSNNDLAAKGKVGLQAFFNASDTTGYHADSFTAADVAATRRKTIRHPGWAV